MSDKIKPLKEKNSTVSEESIKAVLCKNHR